MLGSSLTQKSWFQKAFFDVADALMWGVPSSAILPKINEEYEMELSDVNKLIALVSKELNEANVALTDAASAKEVLERALMSTGPIGDFADSLAKKYTPVAKDFHEKSATVAKKQEELDALTSKAQALQDKVAHSLGDAATKL